MSDEIIPYCMYHSKNAQEYNGIIVPSVRTINGEYVCPKNTSIWKYKDIFYAISPRIRPIPAGTKLFRIEKNDSFPYNTESISLAYDPFDINNDDTYMIVYTQPVPNTKPLYLHRLGTNIYPSFDKNPPTPDPNWKQLTISPVYVLTNDENKFKCVNGRCLPWTKEIEDMYDDIPDNVVLGISECILYCNELENTSEKGQPNRLIDDISRYNISEKNKWVKFGIIFGVLFLITIFVVIIKKWMNSR